MRIMTFDLMALVQAIPIPFSFLASGLVTFWITRAVVRPKAETAKLYRDIALLFGVWVTISVLAGLFVGFDTLEAERDMTFMDSLAVGMRFSLFMVPAGFAVLCLPLLFWMGARVNRND